MFLRQTCFWHIVPTITFSKQNVHPEIIRPNTCEFFSVLKSVEMCYPKLTFWVVFTLVFWRLNLFSWQADGFQRGLWLGGCLCCTNMSGFSCPIFLTEITEVWCPCAPSHYFFSYYVFNWRRGFGIFWS